MKTTVNQFGFPESGNKQKKMINPISISTVIVFLFNGSKAFSQNTSGGQSIDTLINNWVLGGLGVLFVGVIILIVNNALSVLHENGRSVEFSFPVAKKMAQKNKTVGILILILVLSGIIFALKYNV